MAPLNQAKDEASPLPRGLFLSVKDFVGQHIPPAWGFASQSSLTVSEIHRNMKDKLENVVAGHFVPDDSLLDVGRAVPSCDVLMLPWIDIAPDGGSSAMPAYDETQYERSLCSRNDSRTPLTRSSKSCNKFAMRNRSDGTKASSDDLSDIDLENEWE